MDKVGSVIPSRYSTVRQLSAMKQLPTRSVILSAAKDLAIERIVTIAIDIGFLFVGQMLHFVQHDNGCPGINNSTNDIDRGLIL